VKTAGDFVRGFVELAACMQFREHNLGSRNFFGFMNVHWNTPAIVDNRNAIIDVDRDIDFVAVARQRLIDGVIDDFIDKMMQSPFARVADPGLLRPLCCPPYSPMLLEFLARPFFTNV
jgi:hypothetical protein